jgi:hypothetical protein
VESGGIVGRSGEKRKLGRVNKKKTTLNSCARLTLLVLVLHACQIRCQATVCSCDVAGAILGASIIKPSEEHMAMIPRIVGPLTSYMLTIQPCQLVATHIPESELF